MSTLWNFYCSVFVLCLSEYEKFLVKQLCIDGFCSWFSSDLLNWINLDRSNLEKKHPFNAQMRPYTWMVPGESSFWFPFRSTIQFLPLWSMDDKAEAEPKPLLAKYYHVVGLFLTVFVLIKPLDTIRNHQQFVFAALIAFSQKLLWFASWSCLVYQGKG